MLLEMKVWLPVLMTLFLLPIRGEANEMFLLKADEWASPRSAETLRSWPGLQHFMQEKVLIQEYQLFIQYPSGEQGLLWVEEFTSWLNGLGLSSRRIRTEAGREDEHSLQLQWERVHGR